MARNKKFLLIANGDHRNRGCGAITIGTVKILKEIFGSDICVIDRPYSNRNVSAPSLVNDAPIDNYKYDPIYGYERFSFKWFFWRMCQETSISKRLLSKIEAIRTIAGRIDNCCVVLSLGGDNYTLDYSVPYPFLEHGIYAHKKGVKFAIWGATVGPFSKNPRFSEIMLNHLKNEVLAVYAREGRTVKYLKDNGIKNVIKITDPAFVMEPSPVKEEKLGFKLPANAIGLNLSPIMRMFAHDGQQEDWLRNASGIIEELKEQMKCPIVLIPHVTIGTQNNDYLFMKECLAKIKNRQSIYLVGDSLNARETKWVISKMSCLIGARTHATIAAFSSCIPTVSLAYSEKAMGINESLFGHTQYVVKSQELNAMNVLKTAKRVIENSEEIKAVLTQNMDEIKGACYDAAKHLKLLIEQKIIDPIANR